MKILIIVSSRHNDNTLKIAEAMSEAAPVTVTALENINRYKLSEFDVVGLGSGIYYGKHDKQLINFVKSLCNQKRYCFVFSTSGSSNYSKNNSYLIKLLESKNKIVLGSFGCKGEDKFFIFKLLGGINKGHPNIEDFDAAQQFITEIADKYNNL